MTTTMPKLFYVWITDHSADDGRRSWIVRARDTLDARQIIAVQEDEFEAEVNAIEILAENNVEQIQR